MEYAIWKGKRISASVIAEDCKIENTIRDASRNKELQCVDPDCKQPLIKYCHGDVRGAYFAHVNDGSCDYGAFDQATTQAVRLIQKKLYEHFKGLGYDVQQEVKIFSHHYTHLLVSFSDGDRLAIEIGTQKTTKATADMLAKKYRENRIMFQWVIIGNPEEKVEEKHVCFIKRQQLNEAANGDLFIIDSSGAKVAQARFYNEPYIYKGRTMEKIVSQGTAAIENLIISEKSLVILDANNQFEERISQKRVQFQQEVDKELEAAESAQKQYGRRWKRLFDCSRNRSYSSERPPVKQKQGQKPIAGLKTYAECRAEVYPKLRQNREEVRDSYNQLWFKCVKCGRVAPNEEFSECGGEYGPARGICWDCIRRIKK